MSKKNYLTEEEAEVEINRLWNEYKSSVVDKVFSLNASEKNLILDGFRHGYKEALYRHEIIK